MQNCKIFISHSSKDLAAARALVELLEKAFKLAGREILCTSVDGHKLDAGAETSEVLREAIEGAPAFLAIVSAESVASDYVLFEMGARWGLAREIVPLLAPGEGAVRLPAPLKGVHAPALSNSSEMHQLLEKLARMNDWQLQTPAVYDGALKSVTSLPIPPAKTIPPRPIEQGTKPVDHLKEVPTLVAEELDADEVRLLRTMLMSSAGTASRLISLSFGLHWHIVQTKAVTRDLERRGLVRTNAEGYVALTPEGETACWKLGLFKKDQP